ncbi:MAG: transposase [Parcubacteria group bacterium]|nr:transposase [Parcubacteria group bacterium]
MAYSQNPNLPRVRMDAVRLVRHGWSTREVARHFGYTHSAIVKWRARAPQDLMLKTIPTKSSRPHSHPTALSHDTVGLILALRQERNQCAETLHWRLTQEGHRMSLSSVKRVLKRFNCSRYSRWKKWHQYPPRPVAEKPGRLVEIDTIHDGPHEDRLYVYTMLDVCSRFAHALPTEHINTHQSLRFVREAQLSRVRRPNDNAHLERFNRTLQDECLSRISRSLKSYRKEIPEYLRWYNEKRPHMGLSMKSPIDIIKTVPSY